MLSLIDGSYHLWEQGTGNQPALSISRQFFMPIYLFRSKYPPLNRTVFSTVPKMSYCHGVSSSTISPVFLFLLTRLVTLANSLHESKKSPLIGCENMSLALYLNCTCELFDNASPKVLSPPNVLMARSDLFT